MKKFFSVLIICLIISGNVFASDIDVVINGNKVLFTESSGYPFVDKSNRTQVPLRATMEALGCNVEWDEENFCAYVSKDDTIISVPVGKNYIYKNGKFIVNDTISQIKNGRIYLPIRVVLESFGNYVSWDSKQKSVNVDTQSQLMQVHFIDVGQGDSSFIDFGDFEILIDGGNNNKGKVVCDYIKPYVDDDIELLIATHPDADHIGGLDDVLDYYSVDRVIDSGFVSDTKTYTDYINAVKAEGCLHEKDSDIIINIGDDVSFKIIDSGDNWKNSNDMSVVSMLTYGNTGVIFTGDISSDVEDALSDKFGAIDVLKVAHHGSRFSTSLHLLNVLKPSYAVISAGVNNSYGHPAAETLERLTASGVNILGTYNSGNIVLNINKNGYSFNKSSYVPLNEKNIIDNQSSDVLADYIGNRNTKKLHLSVCSSAADILEGNRIVFLSKADAISQGYIPCKKCNP